MLKIGFVKIDRKITQWRWYHDANTFRVFFHLIVTANYEDKDFETVTVKRGERVISYPKLASELKLTEKNVRTAINHLKKTQEVAVRTYPKFSVITINNYNQYQSGGSQTADNGQSSGSQTAVNGQSSGNNERKINKDKESKKDKEVSGKPSTPDKISFGEYQHIKLTQEQFDKLCEEYSENIVRDYIRKMDEWLQLNGKKPYKDFNLALRNWLNRDNIKKRSEENESFYRNNPRNAPF